MVYTGLAPVHGLNGVTRVIGGTGDNPLLDPARYDPPTPANLPGETLYKLALSANFTNSKMNSNPNSAAPISPASAPTGNYRATRARVRTRVSCRAVTTGRATCSPRTGM